MVDEQKVYAHSALNRKCMHILLSTESASLMAKILSATYYGEILGRKVQLVYDYEGMVEPKLDKVIVSGQVFVPVIHTVKANEGPVIG